MKLVLHKNLDFRRYLITLAASLMFRKGNTIGKICLMVHNLVEAGRYFLYDLEPIALSVVA